MVTFQTLQTWIGHVAMFEPDSLVTSISVIFNTHYQTPQTWISINVTRCDSLKTRSVITRIITHITMYFLSDLPSLGLFATRYYALPSLFEKML